MRTFDSRHYTLEGYGPVSIRGVMTNMWILRTRPDPKFKQNSTSTIVVSEAKFVDSGKVYFLKEDGSVEDRTHQAVQVPARAEC